MAKNLEQWRLSQKVRGKPMTCEQAARALGVQEDVFYRWRTGERFPAARKWAGIFQGMNLKRPSLRLLNLDKRCIARAQRDLWRSYEYGTAGRPPRGGTNPPGWERLMAMIGGAK